MSNDVFFARRIDSYPSFYIEERYLFFKCALFIGNHDVATLEQLTLYLDEIYGSVNQKNLRKFIEEHFAVKARRVSTLYVTLKDDQWTCFKHLKRFQDSLASDVLKDKNTLISELSSFIGKAPFMLMDYYSLRLALIKEEASYPLDYYDALFFDMYLNYLERTRALSEALDKVSLDYNDFPVSYIIENRLILDIMFANGINFIKDLKNYSIDSLLLIFANHIDDVILNISSLHESFKSTYKNKIVEFFNLLSPLQKEVIFKRFGFGDEEKLTLEALGNQNNLSRERIRQIEAKALNILNEHGSKVKEMVTALYNYVNVEHNSFIEEASFISYIKDHYVAHCALLVMKVLDFKVHFDDELKIIFNKEELNEEELVKDTLHELGNSLGQEEISTLSNFKKNLIQFHYHEYQKGIYLKNGTSIKDLMLDLIDSLYPDGYKLGNNAQYAKLKEIFEKKYGKNNEIPSPHSIQGYLERASYCQIDKGTYRNRESCLTLDEELKDEIVNYILQSKPMVYYLSVFEHFKEPLTALGISNRYYLKGVLDPLLGSEFNTKRDYISIGDVFVTSGESIIHAMQSYQGSFTFEELKERFIGIKDYTIYTLIYKEEQNGLICLAYNRFIYLKNVSIDLDAVEKLGNYIDELMNEMDTKIITSRKIYAKLATDHKELLDGLKIAYDQYALFSLIKYYFKDKYFYSRPIISTENQGYRNAHTVIKNYVKTLDKFDFKTIKNYSAKLNMRGLYSYLSFMDEMSDDYVQVNMDTMVKKSRFSRQKEKINEVKKLLDLLFLNADSIDTNTFNGYFGLPSFDYPWNKYLLVGLVRTFFDKDYVVECTTNFYDDTDYIIKKMK